MEPPRAFAHATLQSAFVAVWTGDPTTAVLAELGAALEKFVELQSNRAVVLNVITTQRTGAAQLRAARRAPTCAERG